MGFWDDFKDNVLGINPGPSYQQQIAQWQAVQAQQLAEAQAAANQLTNTGETVPTTTTPVGTATTTTPVSTFDATPYKTAVDTGFSMFTPEFYAKKYADYYDPYKSGVENQYGLAKDALTAGIAKKGLTNSQQGRGLFQQLDALRDQSFGSGQTTAQGFQDTLAGQVKSAKDALYGEIGEGKDNTGVGAKAKTEAEKIAATATPSASLGDIFGNLVGPYADATSPGGPANPETQAFATGGNLNLANTGGASTKVVGKKKF